ncbi:MAG: translation elongation factor 4 [Dehalococcoidia bacterium]|nr:translation elongation factor 4 [Dehalococcoidia bacterium]
MNQNTIRNFCIIAHIDHGKSTLADRLLEATGTVLPQDMKEQFLDRMELERERGITIKGKAVTMAYHGEDGQEYQLNLIDTPGHVDFSYEVSRALAACEGALLVVDASQGIEAQTIANAFLAVEHNLVLIPVVNKVDLPQAEPERVASELQQIFGFSAEEIIFTSAKAGTGVHQVLQAVTERMPSPGGGLDVPLRALVFDSIYNTYKGIVAYVRVFEGSISRDDRILIMSSVKSTESMEIGIFSPNLTPADSLIAGQVGYIATGLKDVRECGVGDTLTTFDRPAETPLPGYVPLKPMVFAGLYPADGEEYQSLRTALEKLQLNDAALTYEFENSPALGFGFRCGFLGLLHMDIVQERLEREYFLNIVITAPSVAYRVLMKDETIMEVDAPSKLPSPADVLEIQEPWLAMTIVTPERHVGSVMELMSARRARFKRMEYIHGAAGDDGNGSLGGARVLTEYTMPLSEMLAEFYNQLKSRTQGYASLDYSFEGYHSAPLVKLDILLNMEPVDALSMIIHKDKAYQYGRALVERLKSAIPRQLFEVPIQAAVGNRVIARETVRALRKDVLAKCYGGDVTRKRKLLERQKEGKKRLKKVGRVDIPQEAFMALLKVE